MVDTLLAMRMLRRREGMMALAVPVGRVEPFCQPKVTEGAVSSAGIVQEVGWLDVAVHDALLVHSL